MKLVYVARSNLLEPSANIGQTIRMAAAFANVEPEFRLLAPIDLLTRLTVGDTEHGEHIKARFGIDTLLPTSFLLSGARAGRGSANKRNRKIFFQRAEHWLRTRRPRVVFTRAHQIVRLCIRLELPVIFEQHEPAASKQFRQFQAIADSPSFLGIVTISELLKQEYVRTHGICAENILVLPSGINSTAPRTASARCNDSLRSQLRLDPNRMLVVYSGSLYPHKGAQIMPALAKRLPEIDFLIVGGRPGSALRALESQAATLPNLILAGHRDSNQVSACLDAADICVLPNRADHPSACYTSPLKLFEYMAAGKSIVASDIPALHGVLTDSHNVLLAPPGDIDGFVASIQRLAAEPQLRERLGRQALEDSAQYSWAGRVDRIRSHFGLSDKQRAGAKTA